MAITKQVLNIDDTVSSISNWRVTDKSDFALIDTTVNGENREAFYQRVLDTDGVDLPATVRVGYYPKSNGGKQTANHSIKATYHIKVSDDVANTEVYEPLVVTLAISGPGRAGGLDANDILIAIVNTVAWLLPTSGGSLSLDALNVLKFGVVNTLNTLSD